MLIGASGSGKSSFAREHFTATEVISSDFCRGLVADDENDQAATADAFAVLHFIASRRLAQPRFTVIDATNVQREARQAARRARQAARPVPGRDRARPARSALPGAQPLASPTVTSARTSCAGSAPSCTGRSRACSARGSAACGCCSTPEEVDRRRDRARAAVDRSPRRARAVRHHRRRPRLPRRAGRAARASWATRSPTTASASLHPRDAARCSSATTAIAARTRRRS